MLYNRSGNELRVESRTQNLYTKQMENSIFLCAVADNGNLAVVTEDISAMAASPQIIQFFFILLVLITNFFVYRAASSAMACKSK